MDKPPVFLTLTTDFGLQDPYVGQLKGALLKGCPNATIVDLTHAIPAWDVATAAITIRTSYRFFPDGTMHLIVVDPGVGGGRRDVVLVTRGGTRLVGPDNGLLLPIPDGGTGQNAPPGVLSRSMTISAKTISAKTIP